MGKILEYNNLGAPPADTDLVFMGDYSEDASNPTTKRLTIGDLNKKRNVYHAFSKSHTRIVNRSKRTKSKIGE